MLCEILGHLSFVELFNIISDHRSQLINVNLIAASLDVLYLSKEEINIIIIKVSGEFSEEGEELIILHLFFAAEEDVKKMMDKIESINLNIIDDLFNCQVKLLIFDLVSLLNKLNIAKLTETDFFISR